MRAGAAPRGEREEHVRLQGGGLVLEAVAAVEVAELVGVERLHRALPRAHLLVEDTEDRGGRMQLEVLADVRVLQPGALEERRRVDGAAGRDHRAGPDGDPVAVDAPLDAARRAALDEDAL